MYDHLKKFVGSSKKKIDKIKNSKDSDQLREFFDEHPYQAEVLFVGPKFDNTEIGVESGDHVYLTRDLTPNNPTRPLDGIVLLPGHGVCAYIRRNDIICKIKK